MNKVKSILQNSSYRRVGSNFVALSFLNGIYMLSPLILIPYLIRTIGSEAYGIYIFSWTFIYYFIFIVNYGFDFTSTKSIAIHAENREEISKIYSLTLFSRLALVLISFILLGASFLFIPKIAEFSKLILLGIGVIIGQALFPTWLFQGMQEMKYITYVNMITRILPLVLIFIFVKTVDDLGYIFLFQSVGYLIGGTFSHFFGVRKYKLKLSRPKINEIRDHLKEGWHMFVSTIGISFYREANTLILGFATSNFELVGLYALADRVLRAFQTVFNSFGQALFPYFGSKLAGSQSGGVNEYKKIGLYYALFLAFCVLVLIFIIQYLLFWYVGFDNRILVVNAQILLPVVLIGGLNYYLGVVGLVNLNQQKAFTRYVLIAGATNIVLCFTLIQFIESYGAAISLLSAEIVLLLLIFRRFQLTNQ